MEFRNIFQRRDDKNLFNTKLKPEIKISSNQINKNLYLKPITFFYEIFLLLKIIIFFNIIINFLANAYELRMLESHNSFITLTVNTQGNQTFLGNEFKYCPDEVYVNENKISGEICKSVELTETTNQIKLVWSN